MVFSLRIDLESDKGIREGVPKILNLLAKHNIKVSFYVTMGGESNFFQLLKYRKKLSGKRRVSVFSRMEILRMIFFPKDFVSENKKILKKILAEGHELGIHGWKHREWTRGLEKINVKNSIIKAVEKYRKIFGKSPVSFCAPAFRTNSKVIKILYSNGIKIISDIRGKSPKKMGEIINVPITIQGKGNTPIIEYLAGEGFSDDEIFSQLKLKIKKSNFSSMYIHGMFECQEKIELLDKLFEWIKKNKIKTKKIIEVANI